MVRAQFLHNLVTRHVRQMHVEKNHVWKQSPAEDQPTFPVSRNI